MGWEDLCSHLANSIVPQIVYTEYMVIGITHILDMKNVNKKQSPLIKYTRSFFQPISYKICLNENIKNLQHTRRVLTYTAAWRPTNLYLSAICGEGLICGCRWHPRLQGKTILSVFTGYRQFIRATVGIQFSRNIMYSWFLFM